MRDSYDGRSAQAMSDRSHKRAGAVRCSACGASYDDEAWAMLVLFQRIEPTEVRPFVRDWPEDHCVEVRSCGACARLIAARRWKG